MGCPGHGQELDWIISVDLFQIRRFHGLFFSFQEDSAGAGPGLPSQVNVMRDQDFDHFFSQHL